jgi:predicted DNA-binding transcriptional regulator AlpA
MPRTLHDYLDPQHPPDGFPPWGWLTTPELAQLCRTSQQSIYNWRLRRTGPPSVQDKSGRHLHKLADVLSWIERGARSPEAITVEWIERRFPGVLKWAEGQVQDQPQKAALDHAIEYLERKKLVPHTRKPKRLHVRKFASPVTETVSCP